MVNDSSRDNVAWDIETTGFGWDDQITVSGLWFPQGFAEIVVNTDGNQLNATACEEHITAVTGGVELNIHPVADEAKLLEMMQQLLFDRFEKSRNRLIAFNAESWKGGFDLPFLRTRCIANQIEWILDGIQFADLWEPVKKRLNTTVSVSSGSLDINTLDGSHSLLCNLLEMDSVANSAEKGCPRYLANSYDPYEDSAEAVAAYSKGEYRSITIHNLADIHRTWELGEIVRDYVSDKDVTEKKL